MTPVPQLRSRAVGHQAVLQASGFSFNLSPILNHSTQIQFNENSTVCSVSLYFSEISHISIDLLWQKNLVRVLNLRLVSGYTGGCPQSSITEKKRNVPLSITNCINLPQHRRRTSETPEQQLFLIWDLDV